MRSNDQSLNHAPQSPEFLHIKQNQQQEFQKIYEENSQERKENSEVQPDSISFKHTMLCRKCSSADGVSLAKRGSSSFEFSSWVLLFPLGIFYSPWRHLMPKIPLCEICLPRKRRGISKAALITNFLMIIIMLGLLLYYKKDIEETHRQLQQILESLEQVK